MDYTYEICSGLACNCEKEAKKMATKGEGNAAMLLRASATLLRKIAKLDKENREWWIDWIHDYPELRPYKEVDE